MAERPLTVGHDRVLVVGTGQLEERLQLPQRLAEAAEAVESEAAKLTHLGHLGRERGDPAQRRQRIAVAVAPVGGRGDLELAGHVPGEALTDEAGESGLGRVCPPSALRRPLAAP